METEAFERAVREHQRMVFSMALHALRDRALAEEITQDVFLALLEQGGGIESAAHLVYWLRRVTARRCIDQMRRQRFRRWLPLSGLPEAARPAVPATGSDPLLSQRLTRLIAALPAATRVALVLRYQEDLEPAEIGRVLGIPQRAVRNKLRQALTSLKLRLTPPRPVAQPPLAGAALPPVGLWLDFAPRQRTPALAPGVSELPRAEVAEANLEQP